MTSGAVKPHGVSHGLEERFELSGAVFQTWWRPERHAPRRSHLLRRGELKRRIRRYFEDDGFVEVETSQLQVSPGNEAHLHAFRTDLEDGSGGRAQRYLPTSPEFSCKKLLAAGERRIFEFARVFRNRERGPLHHPEFSLLEWYRAGAPLERVMEDCAALLTLAADLSEAPVFEHRGRSMDPRLPPERVSVDEAFRRWADIDLLATLAGGRPPDREALASGARASGVRVAADDTWSDIFSKVLVTHVEPRLGEGRATILYDYPAAEAALARLKPQDARVAERFELYACGVELANAFGELTDAREQRRRLEKEMDEKARIYGERYPLDEDFLAALDHMPPASGAALGFDRLVMLATGAADLDAVVWTPPPPL